MKVGSRAMMLSGWAVIAMAAVTRTAAAEPAAALRAAAEASLAARAPRSAELAARIAQQLGAAAKRDLAAQRPTVTPRPCLAASLELAADRS
jgi:hypothetical protein